MLSTFDDEEIEEFNTEEFLSSTAFQILFSGTDTMLAIHCVRLFNVNIIWYCMMCSKCCKFTCKPSPMN